MKVTTTVSPSVKYGLHIIGISSGTSFPLLHKLYWIAFMGTFQYYQYRYIIQHFYSDSLMETIDNFCIVLISTVMSAKLIISWVNYSVLCEILATMEEECHKYAASDTNNLIIKTAYLSYRLTTTLMIFCVIAVIFYDVGSIISLCNDDSEVRSLHFKMDLPFDTNKSPVYEIVITIQLLHQMVTGVSFATFSALLIMMVLHVGCQIDIMCHTLTDVPVRGKEQFKVFIKRHRELIALTNKIEQYFTYAALSQLFSNTLNTCCLGFLIATSIGEEGGLPILIKSILFYIVMWSDAFLSCFAGEYLSIKSNMICETAYQCLWYDLPPNESRLLIIVILKSQKGLKLTFGNFSSLSLESFMSMMKASASYMSVLLAMS